MLALADAQEKAQSPAAARTALTAGLANSPGVGACRSQASALCRVANTLAQQGAFNEALRAARLVRDRWKRAVALRTLAARRLDALAEAQEIC